MMNFHIAAGSALLFLFISSSLLADNWPQWRGAIGDGVSTEKNIPAEWDKTKNVAWKLDLPGAAGSTPAIWEDKVFLTSIDGNDLLLMAVSTSGNKLWSAKLGEGNRNVRTDEGNTASPSPATDGKHVWATMANGIIACFLVDGQEVWKFDLQERYGKFKIQFGMTATPVLHGGKLYVQLIHGEVALKLKRRLLSVLMR